MCAAFFSHSFWWIAEISGDKNWFMTKILKKCNENFVGCYAPYLSCTHMCVGRCMHMLQRNSLINHNANIQSPWNFHCMFHYRHGNKNDSPGPGPGQYNVTGLSAKGKTKHMFSSLSLLNTCLENFCLILFYCHSSVERRNSFVW
jgi:hypothetical protein